MFFQLKFCESEIKLSKIKQKKINKEDETGNALHYELNYHAYTSFFL